MQKTSKQKGRVLTCTHCGGEYYVPQCRSDKSKFCSRSCREAAQKTLPDQKTKCATCGDFFYAKPDHGKPRKYCSRDCFDNRREDKATPTEKECPVCGAVFFADRSSHESVDGLQTYCSVKCQREGRRKGVTKECVVCGEEFYISRAAQRQRPDESCCSDKCQRAFYTAERSSSWGGGLYVDTGTGHVRQLFPRKGFSSKYLAEHRVIAAKAVGRLLRRDEMVLHINDKRDDNRPENLFICASISEMARRRNGSLPWPETSNLTTYK